MLDITKPDSVESARYYLEQAINQYGIPNDTVFLVANKSDLDDSRTVDEATINNLASEFSVSSTSVSAKNGSNVNKLFEELVRRLLATGGGANDSLMYEGNPKIEFRSSSKACSC